MCKLGGGRKQSPFRHGCELMDYNAWILHLDGALQTNKKSVQKSKGLRRKLQGGTEK